MEYIVFELNVKFKYSLVERRTSSDFSPSLQGDSSCTIANEFQDDLIDDGVRKGRKVAERSMVLARKTVMNCVTKVSPDIGGLRLGVVGTHREPSMGN